MDAGEFFSGFDQTSLRGPSLFEEFLLAGAGIGLHLFGDAEALGFDADLGGLVLFGIGDFEGENRGLFVRFGE